MLVLSRKRNQTIVIGDQIEVHVLDVRGGVVRLGFNAPRDVVIHRQEVYQRVNGQPASPPPARLQAPRLAGALAILDENR